MDGLFSTVLEQATYSETKAFFLKNIKVITFSKKQQQKKKKKKNRIK